MSVEALLVIVLILGINIGIGEAMRKYHQVPAEPGSWPATNTTQRQ